MPKVKKGDVTHTFPTSPEAFALAKRMSRYSHRDWIVWRVSDGTWKTAKLRMESLEECMSEATGSETRPGYFSCIGGDGIGQTVGPNLAKVWMGNMKSGHFFF